MNILGKDIYKTHYAVCHQVNGEGIQGHFLPSKEAQLRLVMLAALSIPSSMVVEALAMQAFDNRINREEIAAVVTYQRNAWGNDTGDVVRADNNAYKVKRSRRIRKLNG